MGNGITAFVILGASGDLTRKKIIPALSRLFEQKILNHTCAIVGSGRSQFTDNEFRDLFDITEEFAKHIFYHSGIQGLKNFLKGKCNFSRVVVFMSLPPEVYSTTAHELYENGFREDTSLIIEKPFGYDYASAVALDRELSRYFTEEQIYRNDHYLAKESVQNMLVFRFANQIFQPLWNAHNIESIQISATETQGVGSRGRYFDKAGIIRDMAQNHLMQLLSLLTMEVPLTLSHEDITSRKINLIKSLSIDSSFRYQYKGYTGEKDVNKQSATETYSELKLSINNSRWAGMPVYVRCGKALNRAGTEIAVKFKETPRTLFNKHGEVPQNIIIFKIQPLEGIIISMSSKEPGSEIRLVSTNMSFCYHDSFDKEIPEAYQKILIDVLRGDHTLFVTAEETELLWKVFEPVLDKGPISIYEKGEIPPTALDVKWADFEKYHGVCSKGVRS
jgi:glucose-6-phosphate 1-dehydrogenase